MKVIVGYVDYHEKEIEIDDSFAPCANLSFSLEDRPLFNAFIKEVIKKFDRPDGAYDGICCILNEDREYLVEF